MRYLSLIALAALAGCMTPARSYQYRNQKPSPCRAPVAPIRNNALGIVISVNYTYTPQDADGGRTGHRGDIMDELNNLGRGDGNSFAETNGQQPNFYLTYSISNDGQDHFTGNVELSGWGQGHVTTINKYQYPYASSTQLVKDLTDEAYDFLHQGWHDARPNCSQTR